MEKVLSIVRQRYGLSPRDKMENLVANAATWCIFMSVTLQVAVHSGTDYTENLRSTRKSVQEIIETVVSSDSEADHWPNWNYWYYYDWLAAAHVEWDDPAEWQGCSVCNRKKPCVFSDPVLRVGGTRPEPENALVSEIKWFTESRYLKDLDRIDREQIEFECEKFPQNLLHCRSSTRFKRCWVWTWALPREGSSSCQCGMTFIGENEETMNIGHVLGLDRRRNGTEPMSTNLMENGRKLLKARCSTLPKADILCSVLPAYWTEEDWKAKEKDWNPFTSTVGDDTIELNSSHNFSVNQLRVYGTLADLCPELAKNSRVNGKPAANDNLEFNGYTGRISCCLPYFSNRCRTEIDQTLFRCQFLEKHRERTVLHYTWCWCTWRYERVMSRVHLTSKWGIIPRERVNPWKHEESAQFWMVKSVIIKDVTVWKSWSNLYLETEQFQFLGFISLTESTNRNRNVRRWSCRKCVRERSTGRDG